MKFASLFLLICTLLVAGNAQANDIRSMTETIKKPITLKASKSERLNVVFNHSSHKGINCFGCHHEVSENGRYVSCSVCHTEPGRSKDPMSTFMAFHAKDVKQSCYGCHIRLAKEKYARYGKTFTNCRPCHMASKKTTAN